MDHGRRSFARRWWWRRERRRRRRHGARGTERCRIAISGNERRKRVERVMRSRGGALPEARSPQPEALTRRRHLPGMQGEELSGVRET